MAMALHLKPHITLRRNPNFIIHLFSTSSSSNNGEESNNNNNDNTRSPSPLQSHFKDVKASLRQTPTSPQQTRPSFSFSTPSRTADLDEIRKNLSQFRSKSAPEPSAQSPPPPQQSTRAISFQELYKRNVMQKNEGGPNGNKTGVMVDVIRESLKNMRNTQSKTQGSHVNKDILRQTLNTSPTSGPTFTGKKSSVVLGGSETAPPPSFLTKETSGKTEGEKKNELVKSYSYDELGVKLRKLRPTDGKVIGNNWLSFKELNERLVKLRAEEEREMTSSGSMFMGLRESLMKLNDKSANNNKKSQPAVRLDFLSTLGGTETFLRGDPKEHLVEKYFHPDNMSSAEKLKLELKKIRDEFKLSESDCGSSRVQVAQLTVKIKHLSSVLHKKDKHSRKGLQEMVQRRKKLLKYLRRTDWDSYCFCLSKLGLRDNPDYKN